MPTLERQLKDAMYGQLARLAKAIASSRRIELLEILAQHPRTVEDLAQRLGQNLSTTSHHLQKLKDARLVETEREAQFIRYRVADPVVLNLLGALREAARARLAEIEHLTSEILGDAGPLTEMSRDELVDSVKHGRAVLIDVRPTDEFANAHISGAKNVPIDELPERLAELDAGVEVVAYCRGPYCLMAADAVKILEARGVRARRLEDGVVDWIAAGLPVAFGEGEAA